LEEENLFFSKLYYNENDCDYIRNNLLLFLIDDNNYRKKFVYVFYPRTKNNLRGETRRYMKNSKGDVGIKSNSRIIYTIKNTFYIIKHNSDFNKSIANYLESRSLHDRFVFEVVFKLINICRFDGSNFV